MQLKVRMTPTRSWEFTVRGPGHGPVRMKPRALMSKYDKMADAGCRLVVEEA